MTCLSGSFITLSVPFSILYVKGAVHWHCLDEKPFSLTASFIMKCDVKCYDYAYQNGRPWTAVYNNVQALVMIFLAYNVSVDWQEENSEVEQTTRNICARVGNGLLLAMHSYIPP